MSMRKTAVPTEAPVPVTKKKVFGIRCLNIQRETLKVIAKGRTKPDGSSWGVGPFYAELVRLRIAGKNARKIMGLKTTRRHVRETQESLRKTLVGPDESVIWTIELSADELSRLEAAAHADSRTAPKYFLLTALTTIEGG